MRARRSALVCVALIALGCERRAAPAPAGSAAAMSASPGAVPALALDDRIFAGGVKPAGILISTNPDSGDSSAAHEGGRLFTAMNCDGCHGGGATGWVGPSLSDGRWRYGGSDADVFRSIYYGRPKGMPSFGGVLGPSAVWQLVTYVRSLPPPKDVPTERW